LPEIAQFVLLIASPSGRVGEAVQLVGAVPPSVAVMVVMAASFTKEKGEPE
jgi:hypothetical protein